MVDSLKVLIILVPFLGGASADISACVTQDSCSCRLADGRTLSLRSLANSVGKAAFKAEAAAFGYDFFFNPCLSFTEGGCRSEAAVCQHELNQPFNYTCGLQTSAQFVHKDGDNSNIYLKLPHGDNDRQSYVKLICQSNSTTSTFQYSSEDPVKTYNFELRSPCACPGQTGCDELPKISCQMEDDCSCRMSDGSGLINLRALSKPQTPLVYKQKDSVFYYNPCRSITVNGSAADKECVNVSLCESVASHNTNLGGPRGVFKTGADHKVYLYYKGSGGRTSQVDLLCDRSTREYPIFTYNGRVGSEYTFSLRSVCACPEGCVSPPRTCQPVDSCSCRFQDGSGLVSLRYLDNPFAPLKLVNVNQFGLTTAYYYNPCSGLKLGKGCFNVSGCQQLNDTGTSTTFRIGQITPVTFSQSADGPVTLKYSGGDDDRNFQVNLICDPRADVPSLENATEEPLKTYKFDLRSKCACPNGCPMA